ncbi:hypothetical protein TSST111916_18345 [Tsukamurella strandjordii]
MYCQMSSSVQLDRGKTRMCSPRACRPLKMFHSSGRCARGSHCPNRSRKLKMRSLARALSSSRRAPPKAASKRCSAMLRSSVAVCSRLRVAPGPVCSTTAPESMSSCTLPISRRTPIRAARSSRKASTSSKLWPVSMCSTGNGIAAGQKALAARCSMTTESLPPENSSTGRSKEAATSRKMYTASASSSARWAGTVVGAGATGALITLSNGSYLDRIGPFLIPGD